MATIYIAGSVRNVEPVKTAYEIAAFFGFEPAFDWTEVDQERFKTDRFYRDETLKQELHAAGTCDLFCLRLPGGRGAHIELGYALACERSILIFGDREEQFSEVGLYQYSHHQFNYINKVVGVTQFMNFLNKLNMPGQKKYGDSPTLFSKQAAQVFDADDVPF